MDTRTTMIVAKGKPITSSIDSCNYDKIANKWNVTFKSGKHFQYNATNVVFLRNPVYLNPMNYRFFYDGKPLDKGIS